MDGKGGWGESMDGKSGWIGVRIDRTVNVLRVRMPEREESAINGKEFISH